MCLFACGCYEPNELYFLDLILKEGDIFVDIGANEGIYTAFASKKVGKTGKVIAIEPSPREIESLSLMIKLNKLENVVVVKKAVYDSNGIKELKIAKERNSGHNTFGEFVYSDVEIFEKINVTTITLDQILEDYDPKLVKVIKIDVEGAETSIFKASKDLLNLKYRPIIIYESNEKALLKQNSNSLELFKTIQNLNFTCYSVDNNYIKYEIIEGRRITQEGNIIAVPNELIQSIKDKLITVINATDVEK
jgi:FkbM family methyltransferase